MNFSQTLNNQIIDCVTKTIDIYIEKVATQFSLSKEELYLIWNSQSVSEKSKPTKQPTVQENVKQPTIQENEHLNSLQKPELVALCKSKGLKTTGTKIDLISRLIGKNDEQQKPISKSSKKQVPTHPAVEQKPVVSKLIKPHISNIEIRRNKYGRYEHSETKLVFDQLTQKVVGKQDYESGYITPLTPDGIELCKKYKFQYVIPDNLDTVQKGGGGDDDEEEEEIEEAWCQEEDGDIAEEIEVEEEVVEEEEEEYSYDEE